MTNRAHLTLHCMEIAPDVGVEKSELSNPEPLERSFLRASGNLIHLNAIWREKPYYGDAMAEVDNAQLNSALEDTIPTPKKGVPVQDIALIFASKWSHKPSIYGIMFDADVPYHPSVGGALSDRNDRPREGCAVFIQALAARSYSAPHVRRTALHELGHVFNLPHDLNGASIMTQTRDGLPDQAFTDFTEKHREFLGNVNKKAYRDYVWPGGAAFNKRGGLLLGADDSPSDAPNTRKKLELRADVAREWYLPGEAIILDVEVRARPGTKRSYVLPDELDPGYERFRIWIEHPDGTRSRYRPLQHYCGPRTTIEVKDGKPLANNISIFWGAGGFQCPEPGEYAVEAEFTLDGKNRERLVSNRVSFEVRAPVRCSNDERRVVGQLLNRNAARAQFYRSLRFAKEARQSLKLLAGDAHDGVHTTFPRYLIGRHLFSRLEDTSNPTRKKYFGERCASYLQRALSAEGLNHSCARHADRMLDAVRSS